MTRKTYLYLFIIALLIYFTHPILIERCDCLMRLVIKKKNENVQKLDVTKNVENKKEKSGNGILSQFINYKNNILKPLNSDFPPVTKPMKDKLYSFQEIIQRYHLSKYEDKNFTIYYSSAIEGGFIVFFAEKLNLFIDTINHYLSISSLLENNRKGKIVILQSQKEFLCYNIEWHNYKNSQLDQKRKMGQREFFRGVHKGSNNQQKNEVVLYYKKFMFDEIGKHECFHMYLNNYFLHAPRWINEGIAQISEKLDIGQNKVNLKKDHRRYKIIKKMIKNKKHWMPFKAVLFSTLKDWRNPEKEVYLYQQSWAICNYLLVTKNEKYSHLFKNVFKGIYYDMDMDEAMRQIYSNLFNEINLETFEKDLKIYYQKTHDKNNNQNLNIDDDQKGLKLGGVFKVNKEYQALINRKMVKKGDIIRGYEIVEISKTHVELKNEFDTFQLTMDSKEKKLNHDKKNIKSNKKFKYYESYQKGCSKLKRFKQLIDKISYIKRLDQTDEVDHSCIKQINELKGKIIKPFKNFYENNSTEEERFIIEAKKKYIGYCKSSRYWYDMINKYRKENMKLDAYKASCQNEYYYALSLKFCCDEIMKREY